MTENEPPFPELAELLASAPEGTRVYGADSPNGFVRMSAERLWALAFGDCRAVCWFQ